MKLEYLEEVATYAAQNKFMINLVRDGFLIRDVMIAQEDKGHSRLVTFLEVDRANFNVLVVIMGIMLDCRAGK